ncbi:MAG TPA: carbon starvation CstA family protein [Candidatus Polarisedimenticolaceae bacterium]|nr:carbon starvation CstA family protein [Candidatus Polarisedimenticolaceae bacterium]
MSLPLLAVTFLAFLGGGYVLYARWVARQFALDDGRATPAQTRQDGVDFVPTRPFYLFAQHFSAIAAAGPIAGPILACQSFGWLPCLIWIGLGCVLIGAVHDFSSLVASVRHGARSVAEIAREHLGSPAGRAMMLFIWIALLYVIVAFADITAGTFVAGTEELRAAGGTGFHPGGAVAMAAVLYLALSVVLGLVQRFLGPPLWLVTVIFVPAAFGAAWMGTRWSYIFDLPHGMWAELILGYCCLASVVPVWLLLQPRGYLGGFILYAALAAGILGVLFGGYPIVQPAFRTWNAGGATGSLFPFLFVTIACGACSGFHGLVCSGTTSKQVSRESHILPVGYGAMLAEGFVAFIALVTVMILAPDAARGLPAGTIYGQGIGHFLTLVLGEKNLAFATTFGAMAFSTFVFDTLDVCMRLGRYMVQELLGLRGRKGALVATAATAILPLFFIARMEEGGWLRFWTIFGASNQLLAALTLLSVATWLHVRGRRTAFVLLPMAFVLATTLWALGSLALSNLAQTRGLDLEAVNGTLSAALVVLALLVGLSAARRLIRAPSAREAETPG